MNYSREFMGMRHCMKYMVVLASLLAGMTSCGRSIKSDAGEKLLMCGDDRLMIIAPPGLVDDSAKVLWQWRVEEAASQLPEEYMKLMIPLDECKQVGDGSRILMTSSGGGVLLLDKETRRSLFYAHVPMAHSAELLPGEKIAVALSTHPQGSSIELYDINRSDRCLFRDSLYSGHGVVWMEAEQKLYALGYDELRAYTFGKKSEDSLSLTLVQTWSLPSEGGHDLISIGGNELLVSTHEHVYLFDTGKQAFTPFAPLADVKNVKSANYDKGQDRLVYTKAEISWWTHHVYIREKGHESHFEVDSVRLYKVRPWK